MIGHNLASFEGRYPKDLFNKSVYTDDNQGLVGYVAKEIGNIIVVFSEFNKKLRFDIPKSDIVVAGSMVIVQNSQFELSRYKIRRDAPFPSGKDLKPTEEDTHSNEAAKVQKADMEEERTVKKLDLEPDKGTNTASIVALPSHQIAKLSNPLTNSRTADRKIQQATEEGHGSPIKIIQTSPVSQVTLNTSSAIHQVQEPVNQKQEYTGAATKRVAGTTGTTVSDSTKEPSPITEEVTGTTVSDSTKEPSPITEEVTGTNPATSDLATDKNHTGNEVQQSAIAVQKDREKQQINPQVEYNTDPKLSSKIEPASTTVYETRPSEVLDITEKDGNSVLTIHDEPNAGFNEAGNDLPSNYFANPYISMSRWHLSWVELYNEFTRSLANLSLNWFDLYWKLWLPTGKTDEERTS